MKCFGESRMFLSGDAEVEVLLNPNLTLHRKSLVDPALVGDGWDFQPDHEGVRRVWWRPPIAGLLQSCNPGGTSKPGKLEIQVCPPEEDLMDKNTFPPAESWLPPGWRPLPTPLPPLLSPKWQHPTPTDSDKSLQ